MRIIIFSGLLVLLCQQMLVMAHVLGRSYSANDLAKLKSLLQQFEETLAADEPSDGLLDYEDGRQEADESLGSPDWDREGAGRDPQERDAQESYRAQKNRLQDLLVSARSKSLSGCFGARIDRIGTSSGLGCGPKRG